MGAHNRRVSPLRVLLATPYGQDGMGGIDRLNDAIADGFNNHPALPGITLHAACHARQGQPVGGTGSLRGGACKIDSIGGAP